MIKCKYIPNTGGYKFMKDIAKYDITIFGEFADKEIEDEFFNYDMRRYSKVVGIVALIFGALYTMFLIADYAAIESYISFIIISAIRVLFFIASILIYLASKKIDNYTNLAYMITAYEVLAVIGFIFIMNLYESFTLLTFLSVIAMTLAIYITPNKLTYTTIVAALLSLSFFIFHAKRLEGMENTLLLKIIGYNLVIILFCNIGAYLTNYYKRRQFLDGRELLRLSITDPLTGIYNRAKFNEEINQCVDNYDRYESPLCLVMFDIDNFKRINDSYGHQAGDRVLQSLAIIIKKSIRSTDIFARWGGEEFVVLLPNTKIQQAEEITERMRISVQNEIFDDVENITCSFGLAALRRNEISDSLLKRADSLLYNAKNIGKNAVVCEVDIIKDSRYDNRFSKDGIA